MKKLPVGIQDFEEIHEGGYLYIDKTKYLHHLISTGKYFFFSRPRRFGKSLLISTLQAIFEGRKELFKGLWIEDKIHWDQYPVIVLDFNKIDYRSHSLEEGLSIELDRIAREAHLHLEAKTAKNKLSELISALGKEKNVVVLVDEYEKPVSDFLGDEERQKDNINTLKNIYVLFKAMDAHLRFVFLTGVSKLGRVSIFSDLNNLYDLTLDKTTAGLAGYTQKELEYYFEDHLNETARVMQTAVPDLLTQIKYWYNGYSWDSQTFVYNPFSILSFFKNQEFSNFWFTTGTPSFLMKLIKEQRMNLYELENLKTGVSVMESSEIHRLQAIPLLFQTGYLTIKKKEFKYNTLRYELSFPNFEVRQSFLENLMAEYVEKGKEQIAQTVISRIQDSLASGNVEDFIETVQAVFASIPYQLFGKDEKYYHSIIYLILELSGMKVMAEYATNQGRIDAVLEVEDYLYIMEFKMTDAGQVIAQIKHKQYYQQFVSGDKPIILLGVAFDAAHKNVGDWKVER